MGDVNGHDDGPAADLAPGVVETHSGVVFFFGDRAYKVKKPLDLGFLDFRTREAREVTCHREVELNRRLAPDVYLGVADVLDPSGRPCDHLVMMRRMPDDRRLASLVTAGADVGDHLDTLAGLMADFHARTDRGPAADRAAGVDALAARWTDNTAGLRSYAGRFVEADLVDRVDELAHRFLAGRRPLFDQRISRGRACDGHGDLLADDVFCLDDGPRVLDCLEFDDALRLDDVLADVAFLAMDLEHLGRPDLGQRFLDAYRTASGDEWPASLADHHIAYRAQVRAKVSAIRADQSGRAASTAEAGALLDLARSHLEAARVRLVLVGGLPGTGKSTLASGIGRALGATVLRSDAVRKELAGIPIDQPASASYGQGLYTGTARADTYRELIERARRALTLGETVVLDASWNTDRDRRAARAAADGTASDLIELRCVTSRSVAEARMAERRRRGADPSDADPTIAAAMADAADDWPAATTIDTDRDPADSLSAALSAIEPTR